MPVFHVESIEDPRVAIFRNLKSARSRRRAPRFVVEGLTLAERLLASPIRVESVLSEPRFVPRLEAQMPAGAALYVASRALVEQLAGFRFHRGVLACGLRPPAPALRDVIPPPPAPCAVAVCVAIQDPENVGGILRTSAAFGTAAVLLGAACADPFSRRVARTSMGANLRIPIIESADLTADLLRLRDRFDMRLVATVLDRDALPLAHAPLARRTAWLFGNEGHGLGREWVRMCDQRVTIPIDASVDSLNVAVAAGIVLHWHAAGCAANRCERD